MTNLRNTVTTGLAWLAGANALAQLASWAFTLMTARLLGPEDYGLLAMAGVYLGLIETLNELGIGAALVQKQDLRPEEIRGTWTASLIISAGFTVLTFLVAPLVARLFGEPRLVPILWVLSASFLFSPTRIVHQSLVTREMRFKEIARIDLVARLAGSAAGFLCALAGMGVWALATAFVGTQFAYAVLYYLHHPSQPGGWSHLGAATSVIKYGIQVTAGRLAGTLTTRADTLVVGRLVGADVLGAYSYALSLAIMPVDKVMSLLNRVLFPVFSQLQREPSRVHSLFLRAFEIQLLAILPCSAMLAVTAHHAVPLVLGPRWQSAVLPLQVFAVIVVFETLRSAATTALNAVGAIRLPLGYALGLLCIMPLSVWLLGSRLGLAGVLLAWATIYPVLMVSFFVHTALRLHARLRDVARAVVLPGAATVLLVIVGVVLDRATTLSSPGRLVCIVLGGGAAYVGAVAWADLARVRRLLGLG